MTTVETSAAQVRKDWGRDLSIHHDPLQKVKDAEHQKQIDRVNAHNALKAEARRKGQPMQGEGGSILKVQQFADEQAKRLNVYRIETGEINARSWAKWDEDHRPFGKGHYLKAGDHEAAEAWARGAHEVNNEHHYASALHNPISDKDHRRLARQSASASFTVRGGDRRQRQLTQAYHEGRAHAHHDLANSQHTSKQGVLAMAGGLRADPDHDPTSTMVSLDIPSGTIEPFPGGLPADEHHITIVYAGKIDAEDFQDVLAAAKDVAAKHGPLHGIVSGLGSFEPSAGSDGLTPYFAIPNVPGIEKISEPLRQFNGSEHEDWKPHVTLTYAEPGDTPPDPVPPTPVTFTHLSVHRGGQIVARIPFTGIRVDPSELDTRDWAKWNAEHPWEKVEHSHAWGEAGAAAEHAKHPHRPTVIQSSVDAKQIPEIPRIPKAEKTSQADQIEVYRKEAQDVSAHQYKIGSSRGQHFEEGYIAARLHAQRENMEPTSAHALAAEHMDVTTSLQANQARAKREGVAAGYRAHADANGQPEHVAPTPAPHASITGVQDFDPHLHEKVTIKDIKPGDVIARLEEGRIYPPRRRPDAGSVSFGGRIGPAERKKINDAFAGMQTFHAFTHNEKRYATVNSLHLEGTEDTIGGGNGTKYARLKVAAPEPTPPPPRPRIDLVQAHQQMGYDAARTGAMRVVPRSILVDHGADAAKAWYTGYDRRRGEEADAGLKPTLGPEETPADKSKYMKGSPKYHAYNEGHRIASTVIATSPESLPEVSRILQKEHESNAASMGPSVERARTEGMAAAYKEHADTGAKPALPLSPHQQDLVERWKRSFPGLETDISNDDAKVQDMRQGLRKLLHGTGSPSPQGEKDAKEFTDLALERAKPLDVTVHRGVATDDAGLAKLTSGASVTLPLSSWSNDEGEATKFGSWQTDPGENGGRKGLSEVVYHVSKPTGWDISTEGGMHATEAEVVTGGKFHVDKVEKGTGSFYNGETTVPVTHVYLSQTEHGLGAGPSPEVAPPHRVGPGDSVIGEKPLSGGSTHVDVKTGMTYRYNEFNKGMTDHSILVQAVDKDGKVVGHVNAHPEYGHGNVNGPVVSVWKYAVADDQRRKGVSRQMIETIHQENPDAKILHSGFVSEAGEKFAESMNPRYNLVKTDKDKGFRKPKGIIEPSLPRETEVNKNHHIVGTPNVGDRITHPELGGGTITSVSSKEATVDFGHAHKRFGVSFDKGATRFEEGEAPVHTPDATTKPIPFIIDHSLDGTGKSTEHVNMTTTTKRGYSLEPGDRLADHDTPIKTIETGTTRGYSKLTMEDGKTVQVKRTNNLTVYPKSMQGAGTGKMLPALPSERLVEDVKAGDTVRQTFGGGDVKTRTVKTIKGDGRGRHRSFRITFEDGSTYDTYKGHEMTVMPPEGAMRPATPADETELEPGSQEFSSFNAGHAGTLAEHKSEAFTPYNAGAALRDAQIDLDHTAPAPTAGSDYHASKRGRLKGKIAAIGEIQNGAHGGLETRTVADLKPGDVVGHDPGGNEVKVESIAPAEHADGSYRLTLTSKDGSYTLDERGMGVSGATGVSTLAKAHAANLRRVASFAAQQKKEAEEKARKEALAAGAPPVPITEAQRVEGKRQLAHILLRSKTRQTERDTFNSDEEYHRRGYATPGEGADEALTRANAYPQSWDVGTDWLAKTRKALMESGDVDEFHEKAPGANAQMPGATQPPGNSIFRQRNRAMSNMEKALDAAQRHDANAESAKANNVVIDKLADAIATGGPSPAGISGTMTDDNIADMRRQVELKLNGDEDPTADLLGLRPNDFARHAAVMEKGDEIAARIDARPEVQAAMAEELRTRDLEANMPKSPRGDEETQRQRAALRTERRMVVENTKKVLHDATLEELMKEPAYTTDGRAEALFGHRIVGTSKAVEDQVREQMAHYPTQWIKNSAMGRTLTVRQTKAGTRNHYQEAERTTQALEKKGATGIVATITNAKGEKSVALHEIGHRMEDTNADLGALEAAHIETRAVGEAARHLGSGYGRGEGSKFDQFMAPYAGKIYRNETRRFHEVFTMGMQSVLGEDESTPTYGRLVGLDGAKADPRLRRFVLGSLALHANPSVQ